MWLIYIGLLLALSIILEPLDFVPRPLLKMGIGWDVMMELYAEIMFTDYAYIRKKKAGKLISKVIYSDLQPRV